MLHTKFRGNRPAGAYKNPYRQDRRADKNSYRHDRRADSQCQSLYISLFGISDLPTSIQEFPSLFNHSPYFERKISLFVFWDVSHV